ncbi:related to Aromatic/aminoadipate aminotransferase 1 [Saccharomycodes ludwigii]|uniref:aromatic-amino-acid transaminase n=1 Tax=Saccharomycodes ludwigii TaxID=36035 RepID=A0A376B4J9_9ASCO|nr:related to Aromatic/aminoadipate aminotransferase 1 [Saccharomycodes ludwigii]
MTTSDILPQAKDFSNLYSRETLRRFPSPIKTTMAYFQDPNIVFLGAGMPPAELFPLKSLKVETHKPPFQDFKNLNPEKSSIFCDIQRDIENLEIPMDVPLSRALQYGNSRGQKELLSFLKSHTEIFHTLNYKNWDIITTTGSTQAWDAALRIFCNEGDTILLEEYTYSSSYEAAMSQGINCIPLSMDSKGIIVESLELLLENWDEMYTGIPKPKLLYTIPTGQNPTGITLCDERKPLIYKLAQKHNLIIIEDEPYYFLQMPAYNESGSTNEIDRFSSHAEFINSLAKSFLSLDTDGRVLRMDSVSKTFAPGCRFGWLTGSKPILDVFWDLHEVSIQSTCGFAQSIINGILNRWGQEGYINWLIKIRQEYTLKRNWCLDNLFKYLPMNIIRFASIPTAGMFFTIYIDISKHPLSKKMDTQQIENYFYDKFVQNGVLLTMGSWFKVKNVATLTTGTVSTKANVVDTMKNESNFIMFRGTYAAVDPAKMELGMKILGSVLKQEFGLD